jgi:hypothetical protein
MPSVHSVCVWIIWFCDEPATTFLAMSSEVHFVNTFR